MVDLPNPKLCVKCGRRGTVTDSRPLRSLGSQRRHHVCKCGHWWNTYETVMDPRLVKEALEDGDVRRLRVNAGSASRTVVRKPR